jgi:hypothetical protein
MLKLLPAMVAALALASAACGPPHMEEVPAAGGAGPASVNERPDTLPQGEWHALDHGRGVLHFREPAGAGVGTDTIALLDARDGALAGRFLREQTENGSWRYTVEQLRGDAMSANLLEYDYEESGLPLEAIEGGWAQVIHGLAADAAPRHAWVRLGPAVAWRLWADELRVLPLFFRDGVEPALHDAPGGARIDFPLPVDDYTLEPDSAAGEWLRVRVTVPHPCSGDPAARQAVAWIRYLDMATGRPRVWYYTRGC